MKQNLKHLIFNVAKLGPRKEVDAGIALHFIPRPANAQQYAQHMPDMLDTCYVDCYSFTKQPEIYQEKAKHIRLSDTDRKARHAPAMSDKLARQM